MRNQVDLPSEQIPLISASLFPPERETLPVRPVKSPRGCVSHAYKMNLISKLGFRVVFSMMIFPMHFPQVFIRYVSVNLRGSDGGMAEQILD